MANKVVFTAKCTYTYRLVYEMLVSGIDKLYVVRKSILIALMLFFGIAGAILFLQNNLLCTLFSALVGCALLLMVLYLSAFARLVSSTYLRMTMGGRANATVSTMQFRGNSLQVQQPDGSQTAYRYAQVVAVRQSRHLYIITMDDRVTVVLEKGSLGSSIDEFDKFIVQQVNHIGGGGNEKY